MTISTPKGNRPTVPSRMEELKASSNALRGQVAEEMENDSSNVTADTEQIIKHHGAYLQDNRDLRKPGVKQYHFLVRTRLPGGKLTAAQFLTELDLCDELADGTLRITDRQGLQLHGVLKHDLRLVLQRIHAAKMTTFGACGDVVRNLMCCPAPVFGSTIRESMQNCTAQLARHFALRSQAYYDIWLKDGDTTEQVTGEPENTAREFEDPVYGKVYLPRKFKFAFALPEDNCVDALTHDVGFMALRQSGHRTWFNVSVGGGMGVTPARTDTFPAVGQPLGLVSSDEILPLAHAIVQLQRTHGNRCDRKRARMKYVVHDWGIERFRDELRTYYSPMLAPPEDAPVVDLQDHLGWHQQSATQWFLGLRIDSGRIRNDEGCQLKTALKAICTRHLVTIRFTALQDLLLCDIEEGERPQIELLLKDHGVIFGDQVDSTRRLSLACPALPQCGLAITESERVLVPFLKELHALRQELGLDKERISIRMTGCPNGCTRPYVAEIGIVGKAVNRYSLFLGGSIAGTRLAFKYHEMLGQPEILHHLRLMFIEFSHSRYDSESFGNFCWRYGAERLMRLTTPASAT